MIIHSILNLFISNAVTSRRDKSILYSRNAVLISAFLENGIGIYGGLFYVNFITHNFNLFILMLSIIILQLTALHLKKIWHAYLGGLYSLFNKPSNNFKQFTSKLQGYFYINPPRPYQSVNLILQSSFNYDPLKLLGVCLALSVSFIFMIYKYIMVDRFGFDLTNLKDFCIVIIPCSIISSYIINFVIGIKNFSYIKSAMFSIVLALSCFFIWPMLIKYLFESMSIVAYFFALFSAVKGCMNSNPFVDEVFTGKSTNKTGESIINSINSGSTEVSVIRFSIPEALQPMPMPMGSSNSSPAEPIIKENIPDISLMEGLPTDSNDESGEDLYESRRKARADLRAAERAAENETRANDRFNKPDPKAVLAEARAKLSAKTGKSIPVIDLTLEPTQSANPFANQTKAEAEAQAQAWTQTQAQIEAELKDQEKPRRSLLDISVDSNLTCKGCKCRGIPAGEDKNAYVNEHVKYMWEAFLKLGDKDLNSNTVWWKSLSNDAYKSKSKILQGLLENNVNIHASPDDPKIFTRFYNNIHKLEKDGVLKRSNTVLIKNAIYRAGKAYYTHIFPYKKII